MTTDRAIELLRELAAATAALADRLDAGEASTRDLEAFLTQRGVRIADLPDRAPDPQASKALEAAIADLVAADRRLVRWCARRRLALRRSLARCPDRPRRRILSEEA